MLLIQTVLEKF